METLISVKSKHLIDILLCDRKIAETVFEDTTNKEKYKICTIRNNGSIAMGKTRIKWWNQLLNCQDVFPFESFALKVWNALVDLSSGINNTAILKGLSQEIVMNAVRDKKYDWVVQRLYDAWAHVAQDSDGFQKPQVPAGNDNLEHENRQYPSSSPRQIVLNIGGQSKIIPIIDSVGDPLRIGVEVGITGFRRL